MSPSSADESDIVAPLSPLGGATPRGSRGRSHSGARRTAGSGAAEVPRERRASELLAGKVLDLEAMYAELQEDVGAASSPR